MAVAYLLDVLWCAKPSISAAFKNVQVSQTPPAFALKDTSGKEWKSAEVYGRGATVVVFWATWSPRSSEVIRDLEALRAKIGPEKVQVVTVNCEHPSISAADREAIAAAAKQVGFSGPVARRRRAGRLQRVRHHGAALDARRRRRRQGRLSSRRVPEHPARGSRGRGAQGRRAAVRGRAAAGAGVRSEEPRAHVLQSRPPARLQGAGREGGGAAEDLGRKGPGLQEIARRTRSDLQEDRPARPGARRVPAGQGDRPEGPRGALPARGREPADRQVSPRPASSSRICWPSSPSARSSPSAARWPPSTRGRTRTTARAARPPRNSSRPSRGTSTRWAGSPRRRRTSPSPPSSTAAPWNPP